MTQTGGANSAGVLFEYDAATNTYTKKLDFSSLTNGGTYPISSLMQSSNGKIYGLTNAGGVNFIGVLFEYDPATNIYSKNWILMVKTDLILLMVI